MIELKEFLNGLKEPFIGCEIKTLADCYSNDWRRFCVYDSDLGGILCRFEGRLLLTGEVDPQELEAFLPSTGAMRIEGLCRDMQRLSGKQENYSVLKWEGGNTPPVSHLNSNPSLKRVHEILCLSDSSFKADSNYLAWLSDITCRRNRNVAHVYTLDDCATATVTAIGLSHALIAQVATLPQHRGKGLSTRLLTSLCTQLTEDGLTPFLVSQGQRLDDFYTKMGFVLAETRTCINL